MTSLSVADIEDDLLVLFCSIVSCELKNLKICDRSVKSNPSDLEMYTLYEREATYLSH